MPSARISDRRSPTPPATITARIIAVLRQAAQAGQPCPSNTQIADQLDLGFSTVDQRLRRAGRAGVIRIEHAGGGRRVISAADGSWRTLPTDLSGRGRAAAAEARLAERRCLACRRPFDPLHRFNFLCVACGGVTRAD